MGWHEQAGLAVLDHLRDAADVGGDDRARERHRLEDREALGLAVGRQDRHVKGRGDGRDVVAPAGEDDPMGDPQFACLRFEGVPPAALADDQQIRIGHGAQDLGPGLDEGRVALFGFEPGHDAHDLGARLHAVLLGQRAARLLVVVPLEIDAVVDERDGDRVASLVADLLLDGPRHRDQPIHVRGELAQDVLVRLVTDPARVDGAHQVRPAMADLGEREDGPGRDGLGPEHVGVDDVRANLGEMSGEGSDADRVIRLVDDEDRDPGALELADGTPR